MARPRMYTIHFPAHCVGVTNMSSHYNLSPTVKIKDLSQCRPKKTTDLFYYKPPAVQRRLIMYLVMTVCLHVINVSWQYILETNQSISTTFYSRHCLHTTPEVTKAVVTCDIKLFWNNLSVLFHMQPVVTCEIKHWNYFKIISVFYLTCNHV